MFVQAMEGRVADREGLRRQLERWERELRPGARGYLGSTVGITDGGEVLAFARFETAAEAMANSALPEQGQWWAEAEKCFDGEVRFTESDDVDSFLAGGSDDAGFVQVMRGRDTDREQVRALDAQLESVAATFRPDLIGGFRMWTGTDTYIEVAYFTSEAAAREGEQKEPPPEMAAQMGELEAIMANVEFVDLRDPWLF